VCYRGRRPRLDEVPTRRLPFVIAVSVALATGAWPAGASTQRPVVSALPAAAAASDTTFTFYGSGFGHGVGMSQWGAYGLALQGWTHVRILRHFYEGTTVGPVPEGRPETFRVGLTWDRTSLHLTAHGGLVRLRVGSPTRPARFTIANGSTWTITPDGGHFAVHAGGKLLGTVGGPRTPLFATYEWSGARVFIAEAGHPYARGHVELNVYRTCQSCTWSLRAIGVMSRQEYLYGLGEVPSEWPMQAMQAQAVAARTYALERIEERGQHAPGCNCGLYPTSLDQAYIGYDKELDGGGWIDAVRKSADQAVLYRGHIILANYFSSSGGHTDSSRNIWGDYLPYLRPQCDPGDYTGANPSRTWVARLSATEVTSRLKAAGYDIGTVTSFTGITRSISSRIMEITVNGTGGSDGTHVHLSGLSFSNALDLLDSRVFVNRNLNVTRAIRTRYDSLMCAPGPATSPKRRLPDGATQRFAAGAIYHNGRNGRTMWLRGPIYRKYTRLEGPWGLLGLPSQPVKHLPRLHGHRGRFQGGSIYLKKGPGAHELHGRVLRFYLSRGGAWGDLGFPTSDVERPPSGGVTATFQGGTIVCPPSESCRVA